MAPTTETRFLLEARQPDGFTLPPWTRADDDEDEDFALKRRLGRKQRRQDSKSMGPTDSSLRQSEKVARFILPTSHQQSSDSESDSASENESGQKGSITHGGHQHDEAGMALLPAASTKAALPSATESAMVGPNSSHKI